MILTDTGPLVALINRNDPNHGSVAAAAKALPSGPLATTWPCFTEAMYLLYRSGGHPAQAALWALRETGRLLLVDLGEAEIDRMRALMAKYADKPMDLADASLVAAAEHLATQRVFTLDGDFNTYRTASGAAFEMVP